MMGWIIINPANQTYDGLYASRDDADEACEYWKETWGEPMCYVHHFKANAMRELEPHYKFMADAKYEQESV